MPSPEHEYRGAKCCASIFMFGSGHPLLFHALVSHSQWRHLVSPFRRAFTDSLLIGRLLPSIPLLPLSVYIVALPILLFLY